MLKVVNGSAHNEENMTSNRWRDNYIHNKLQPPSGSNCNCVMRKKVDHKYGLTNTYGRVIPLPLVCPVAMTAHPD